MSSSSSSSGSDSEPEAPQQRTRVASSSSSASSHHSAPAARAATPEAGSGSGSERSHASPERSQQRRLIASSSDEEEQDQKKSPKEANHGDVFGDEVSSDSDNEEGDAAKPPRERDEEEGNKSDAGSEGSIRGIQMYNDPEEEQQMDEDMPPQIITSEVPKLKFNIGDEIYHVRMPNFLSIETKAFNSTRYEANDDDSKAQDEEGRNRLKLKVENTIRWRKVAGQAEKYESNAKVVKWSDGTMSLYLGNEIFELTDTRLLAHTHLYVRQTHGLAGKAVFEKRLKFRPCSTDSKTHKKVTMNMADRTKKSGQVRFIQTIGNNPNDAIKETVRREEEALRAAFRRERDTTVRTRREPERRGMNSGFLEDRDFSDDGSPSRGRRREAPIIGASSDEESDDGDKRGDRSREASSDSDEEFRKNRPQKKKIVSSDEDSD